MVFLTVEAEGPGAVPGDRGKGPQEELVQELEDEVTPEFTWRR